MCAGVLRHPGCHKSPVAIEALERIGALYAVERDINGRSPEERREIRNTRSRPLLGSLKQWLEGRGQAFEEIGYGDSGSLRARKMGSADALL